MRGMPTAVAAGVIAFCAPAAGAASPAGPYDLDRDGYADLVVGVPGEDVGSDKDAGSVQVLYGSVSGPTARDQVWHQDSKGIKGGAERGDTFGATTASGDFDGDGYPDLAIGIPGEDLKGKSDAGAVQVLYGGAEGLTARDELWHQNTEGVPGSNEAGDAFGASLAAGDFDGDGRWDLAIGVPGEVRGAIGPQGRVQVLRGRSSGLSTKGGSSWNLDQNWNAAGPAQNTGAEAFGSGLATGNFNADARTDLAVFATAEERGGLAGAVHILRGRSTGLTALGAQTVSAADLGLGAPFGGYGLHGVAGDFDKDGADDLAMLSGTADDLSGVRTLSVTRGTSSGLDVPGTTLWHLHAGAPVVTDTTEVPSAADHCTEFGVGLAAGNLTGNGAADLSVGSKVTVQEPGVCTTPVPPGGRVHLMTGGPTGLAATTTVVSQDSPGVPGTSESGDEFGAWMRVLPGPGRAWLAVGAPWESIGSDRETGSVTVFRGAAGGLDDSEIRAWHQDTKGIKGTNETGDHFASGL